MNNLENFERNIKKMLYNIIQNYYNVYENITKQYKTLQKAEEQEMKKPNKERIARIHEDRCWINIQVLCGSYFENVYGYRKEGYEDEIAQQKKEMEEHGYRFVD